MIEGEGPPPCLVLELVQGLPDTALTAALARGGREHFGWGVDRHLQADIFDAINQNTRASGNWGKKGPPDIKPWPRPKGKDAKPKRSVRDIFAQFSRGR